MTIKHLIIAGGATIGIRFLGALKKLNELDYWKMDEIESIYATSIGSVLGAFICLKYDWETLNKYIIERPWHDAFQLSGKQLLDSYFCKGLYDKKILETVFKPLFLAKDLTLNITLKEFYEYSKIDLHIFTFELNQFETVEMSHTSHPELELLQALTMSCALPGIIMPIIEDDKCYLDGGIMCNFPVNHCLRDHPDKNEILGINTSYKETDTRCNSKITEDSSLLEYILGLSINSMNFISKSVKQETMPNMVKCVITESPMSLDIIKETVNSQDKRRQLIADGENDAETFIEIQIK
jgi:predicted acylesterase/phospholipase RssA